MKSSIELYIHIPFCIKKCNYCDFLSFPAASDIQKEYIEKLKKELTITAPDYADCSVSSVFVGGGTPSIISDTAIAGLMDTVRAHYNVEEDAEISIETNPGTTLRHKFSSYRKAGINRLSIGLQSADNSELKMLGRIHSFEEFLKSYEGARMEGFTNINVDLMNCFPNQTLSSWKKTLKNVVMLKPEHISIYNLIVEPGTPFYSLQEEGILRLPDEDTQAEIDEFTKEHLLRTGYERYEISNWAKPGHECRHNLGYWSKVPYLGFGLGASSYFDRIRWKNTSKLKDYLESEMKSPDDIRIEKQILSKDEEMSEFVYLGLRKTAGISETDFIAHFGQKIENVFEKQLEKYIENGLMEHENYRYRLTDRGLDVSNVILSDFV